MMAFDNDDAFRALCDEDFNSVERALSSKFNMNQQLSKDGCQMQMAALSKFKLLVLTTCERLRANNYRSVCEDFLLKA